MKRSAMVLAGLLLTATLVQAAPPAPAHRPGPRGRHRTVVVHHVPRHAVRRAHRRFVRQRRRRMIRRAIRQVLCGQRYHRPHRGR